jgi:hypothetical protein
MQQADSKKGIACHSILDKTEAAGHQRAATLKGARQFIFHTQKKPEASV